MIRHIVGCVLTTVMGCGFTAGVAEDDTGIDAGMQGSVDAGAQRDGSAAGSDTGGMLGDAAIDVTLSETTSDTVSIGKAIYCNNGGAQTARDNAWFRAFRLTDFGITDTFHVSSVHLASQEAKGAPVTVSISSYTGATGGGTLDTAALTPLASVAAAVPDSDSPQTIAAAIAATIPASSVFVVKVASTDTQNASGVHLTYFHLGANVAGQTAPGYFASAACGEGTPSSQSNDFIIDIEGTH